MTSQSSQFNSTPDGFVGFISTQTADPSPSAAKSRDVHPMHPVTVKKIVEAESSTGDNSNFLIDGISVHNVKLVGMVFDKVAKKSDVSFVLDDGTGRTSCIKWINDTLDTEEVEELTDGVYVRVHGSLSTNQGKRQIKVIAIRPVTDYNEIAYHFIECAHAHMCNTRLQKNASATLASSTAGTATSTSSAAGSATLISSTVGFTTATAPINGHQAISSSHISQQNNADGLEGIQKMVMDYLKRPSSVTRDIDRDEIARNLKISQEKIKEAMKFLELEGMVYTTIDDHHYKSC